MGEALGASRKASVRSPAEGSVSRIRPGDTVNIPGEEHWHGGTATTFMSHLAIVTAREDDPTTWLEAVTEEEFAAAQ